MSDGISTASFGGWTCPTCGQWIQPGVWHQCPAVVTWTPNQTTGTVYWPQGATMTEMKRFRGALDDLRDLPKAKKAVVGDGYYVKAWDTLAIRQTSGWLMRFNEDE